MGEPFRQPAEMPEHGRLVLRIADEQLPDDKRPFFIKAEPDQKRHVAGADAETGRFRVEKQQIAHRRHRPDAGMPAGDAVQPRVPAGQVGKGVEAVFIIERVPALPHDERPVRRLHEPAGNRHAFLPLAGCGRHAVSGPAMLVRQTVIMEAVAPGGGPASPPGEPPEPFLQAAHGRAASGSSAPRRRSSSRACSLPRGPTSSAGPTQAGQPPSHVQARMTRAASRSSSS